MKISKSNLPFASALLVSAVAVSTAANAQVMTEVRVSTSGDDQEYIEILGTPGQSTDGLMILVVEGDPSGSTGGAGNLDKVYDLANNIFAPNDEYFVFGSSPAEIAFPGEIDQAGGANLFENSSLTIYLVNVPDPALRNVISTVWDDTDITDPVGSMTTRIATDPGVTILDAVALTDGDVGDIFYDGAPVFGPDGTFFTPGILRDGGCPGNWCTSTFINFQTDGVPNPPFVEPTPGAINPTTSCSTTASDGLCPGTPGGGTLGLPYCMTAPNSTSNMGQLAATGSLTISDNNLTLEASSLPALAFGFFVVSVDQGLVMNPGGSTGNLCLAGSIGRYVGPGQIQPASPSGTLALALDLTAIPMPTGPVAAVPGDTFNFQGWYRDSSPTGATSNFTRGLEITLN